MYTFGSTPNGTPDLKRSLKRSLKTTFVIISEMLSYFFKRNAHNNSYLHTFSLDYFSKAILFSAVPLADVQQKDVVW